MKNKAGKAQLQKYINYYKNVNYVAKELVQFNPVKKIPIPGSGGWSINVFKRAADPGMYYYWIDDGKEEQTKYAFDKTLELWKDWKLFAIENNLKYYGDKLANIFSLDNNPSLIFPPSYIWYLGF